MEWSKVAAQHKSKTTHQKNQVRVPLVSLRRNCEINSNWTSILQKFQRFVGFTCRNWQFAKQLRNGAWISCMICEPLPLLSLEHYPLQWELKWHLMHRCWAPWFTMLVWQELELFQPLGNQQSRGSPRFFLQQCYESVVVIACQRGTWGKGQSLRISSHRPISNFTMSALELGHKIMKTNYWAGVDGTINLQEDPNHEVTSMPWSWLQVTSPDMGDRDILQERSFAILQTHVEIMFRNRIGEFITRLHLGEFMQFTLND